MIIRHPCHPSHLCQDPNSISRTFLEQLVIVDLIPVPGRRRWCLVSANLTGEASLPNQPFSFLQRAIFSNNNQSYSLLQKGDLCEQCDADKKLCGEHSRLCPVHQVLSGVGKPCQVFFFLPIITFSSYFCDLLLSGRSSPSWSS